MSQGNAAVRIGFDGIPLDVDPIALPAGRLLQLASHPLGYLAVWNAGDPGAQLGQITAVPLDESGVLGSPVVLSSVNADYPLLVFDGTNYLVSWQESRPTGFDPAKQYAARVSPVGTAVDALGGFEVPSLTLFSANICGGGRCLLGADGGGVMLAGRDLLTPEPVSIGVRANEQFLPVVAEGDGLSLFVWEDMRVGWDEADIYAARIDSAGQMLDPQGIPVTTAPRRQTRPRVGWTGSEFLVAWSTETVTGFDVPDVGTARIGMDGVVTPGEVIARAGQIAVACGAAGCLTVWLEFPDNVVHLRGLARDVVLDAAPWGLALASDATGFLLAWKGGDDSGEAMRGLRIDAEGEPLSEEPFTIVRLEPPDIRDSYSAGSPALASSGCGWLLAWSEPRKTFDGCRPDGDRRCATFDIHATRVSPTGHVLDGSDIVVEASDEDALTPAVAWTGRSYLVTWTHQPTSSCADPLSKDCRTIRGTEVFGVRVTVEGELLDAEPFVVAGGNGSQVSGAVAMTTTGALAAYTSYDDAPEFRSMRVRARSITDDAAAPATVCPSDDGGGAGCGCSTSRRRVSHTPIAAFLVWLLWLRRRRWSGASIRATKMWRDRNRATSPGPGPITY